MEREIVLFEAPGPDGVLSGTRTAWQRRDMLVLVPHEGCERCDKVLAALETQTWPDDVARFAVRSVAMRAGELADPEGLVVPNLRRASGLAADRAVALVADRFAQLYAAVDLHAGEVQSCARDVAEWVSAAQKACAECSRMGAEDR